VRWFKTGDILPEYNTPFEWEYLVDDTKIRHLAIRTHYDHNPYLPDDSKAKYELFREHNYAYYERYCLGI